MLHFITKERFGNHCVFSVAEGHFESELLAGCAHGWFLVCDLDLSTVQRQFRTLNHAPVTTVAAIDAELYFCASRDGELGLWNAQGSLVFRDLSSSASFARPLLIPKDFLPDGLLLRLVAPGTVDGSLRVVDIQSESNSKTSTVACPRFGKSDAPFGLLMALTTLKTVKVCSKEQLVVCVFENHISVIHIKQGIAQESWNNVFLNPQPLPQGVQTPTAVTAIHNRLYIFDSFGHGAVLKLTEHQKLVPIVKINLIDKIGLSNIPMLSKFQCSNAVQYSSEGVLILALWDGLLVELDPMSLSIVSTSKHRIRPVQSMSVAAGGRCLFTCTAMDATITTYRIDCG